MTLTRRSADTEMGLAHDIVKRYPALHDSLEAGKLDLPKVRTIIRGVGHVDSAVANKAIEVILPDAPC